MTQTAWRLTLVSWGMFLLAAGTAGAQAPPDLRAERAAWSDWLAHSAVSPYTAVAQVAIGSGLTLGPADAELPLAGFGAAEVRAAGGSITLASARETRQLPRGRPVRAGRYTFVGGGAADQPLVTVFDSAKARGTPHWFPYDASLAFVGPLIAPDSVRRRRVLSPDGVEVQAEDAGSVVIPLSGQPVRLAVMRLPDPVTGETSLEIYFRDGTNGHDTYPAGRFVALTPAGQGRWRLDFNRARNPFCSYSAAYACPAPWRGNSLPVDIRAGEQYTPKE
jgi:uncharacterized protein (DUF1684 family)